MFKVIRLLLLLFTVAANAQEPGGKFFALTGKVEGAKLPWVYLDYVDANNYFITDSCLLVNGRFRFTGKIGGAVQGRFYQKKNEMVMSSSTLLFLEPGSMQAFFQVIDFKKGKITGSKSQGEYAVFVKNTGVRSTYSAETVYQFIQKHPASYVSAYLLMPTIFKMPLDSTQKYFQLLSTAVQKGADGRVIADFIKKEERIALEKPAPDFTQTDINGHSISLKDFKGKYLLIDFWASWCSPCRLENPNLVAAYKQFSNKNFTVVSVSVDKDTAAWKAAVQKDFLSWQQILIADVDKNKMTQAYNVLGKGIPYNLLIGPEGTILALNLKGENLQRTISQYLK